MPNGQTLIKEDFSFKSPEKNSIDEIHHVGKGLIMRGDCLKSMKSIDSDSAVLAFTSPPYHNAVNYGEHVSKMSKKIERWERKDTSYQLYQQFLSARFEELLRIVKPGGHSVVNISPVAWDGKRIALPFHFVSWMERIGWQFKEDIIWEKEVVRDRRSGVLMQHPYPGYYYPSLAAEYVLVFQKTADSKKHNNIYHHRSQDEKEKNKINLDDYQSLSKNIWKIRPVAPQENEHPCPFPKELARRVIEFYSYKNDTVIDIFAGSGITNIVAEQLDRCHIGLETEEKYIQLALSHFDKKRELHSFLSIEPFAI